VILKDLSLPDDRARSRSNWTIGGVLPRLMLFAFLLDLGLRFVPVDPLTFRAWEAMLRRYPNAEGPFTPDKHYHRDNSYGGVAAIGNLPALRRYHTADFTSDAAGYRNPTALGQSNAYGILLGDSFAVSSELPEQQMLSAQLTRLSGRYFYNAGAAQPLRLRSTESVARRLAMRHGVVIYEFLEAHLLDAPPAATPDGARSPSQALVLRALGTSWADRLRVPLNQWHDSPLEGLAVKLQKQLRNDVLLPNSFADFVLEEKLRNGETMAFLPIEFKSPANPALSAERWAAYFAWYAGELRKDGLDFVVLLVPNRSTIYAPLLEPPRDSAVSRDTLKQLASRLKDQHIPAISLLSRYDAEATARLPIHGYLYLLDDTHWNGDGTAIAAEEILKLLRPPQ
jgi:hypothetical protein